MSSYAFGTTLPAITLAEARPKVQAALGQVGFGVLTEIDLSGTLKAKVGADHPPHVILGACNPKLANQAVSAEPGIALMLPCNVTLRQVGDDVEVLFVDPSAMFQVVEHPDLLRVASEADRLLRQACAELSS